MQPEASTTADVPSQPWSQGAPRCRPRSHPRRRCTPGPPSRPHAAVAATETPNGPAEPTAPRSPQPQDPDRDDPDGRGDAHPCAARDPGHASSAHRSDAGLGLSRSRSRRHANQAQSPNAAAPTPSSASCSQREIPTGPSEPAGQPKMSVQAISESSTSAHTIAPAIRTTSHQRGPRSTQPRSVMPRSCAEHRNHGKPQTTRPARLLRRSPCAQRTAPAIGRIRLEYRPTTRPRGSRFTTATCASSCLVLTQQTWS